MKQGVHGDRYIPVTCEVDALEHKADDLGTEVNRNCEPVVDSTGMIFHLTDTSCLEMRVRLLQKTSPKENRLSARG